MKMKHTPGMTGKTRGLNRIRKSLRSKYRPGQTLSYRDLLPEEVAGASQSDKSSIYLQFIEEARFASEDSKRKMRRRLGLCVAERVVLA